MEAVAADSCGEMDRCFKMGCTVDTKGLLKYYQSEGFGHVLCLYTYFSAQLQLQWPNYSKYNYKCYYSDLR